MRFMKKRLPLIISAAVAVLAAASVLTVRYISARRQAAAETMENAAPAEDVFDADAQREAYYSAAAKPGSMSYCRYNEDMTVLVKYPDREETESLSGLVKTINRGKDDPRYYVSFTDGEGTSEYWYLNGTACCRRDGESVRAKTEETDFGDYIDGKIFLALGEDFYKVEAVKNKDGTCSVTFDGLPRIPDSVTRMFTDRGMTDLRLGGFSGSAKIDSKGRLSEQSAVLKLSMKKAGEDVTAEYSSHVKFESPGQKFTMPPPDVSGFKDIGSIFAPELISRAYENLAWSSETASYSTEYKSRDTAKDTEYSIGMSYEAEISRRNGFFAKDSTDIHFKLKKNDSTVTRTTSYTGGVLTTVSGSSTSTKEMTDDAARSAYYHKLLDDVPQSGDIEYYDLTDNGESWEIGYRYTEKRAKEFCQTVRTTVIADRDGIALNSDECTVREASGVIRIDKDTGMLLGHDINVNALIGNEKKGYETTFIHSLKTTAA